MPDTSPTPESPEAGAARQPAALPSRLRQAGTALGRAAGSAAVGGRAAIRGNPVADKVYKTGVGVVGGATVALGVVLMPLPGPGALISIGGLGILATEFEGAKKVQGRAIAAARKAMGTVKEARARRKVRADAAGDPAGPGEA